MDFMVDLSKQLDLMFLHARWRGSSFYFSFWRPLFVYCVTGSVICLQRINNNNCYLVCLSDYKRGYLTCSRCVYLSEDLYEAVQGIGAYEDGHHDIERCLGSGAVRLLCSICTTKHNTVVFNQLSLRSFDGSMAWLDFKRMSIRCLQQSRAQKLAYED